MTQDQSAEEKQLAKSRKKVEKWLISNKRFINITGIEKDISAPKGLIQKYIKYDKKINDKWIEPIHGVIKKITSFSVR
ncbi:hypothetical protein NBT05_16710 [Aquimarina sp. ERC-38]|uniref:hypothetical protein n=1 Tax=Aquimarina sp. ERC-38 TaxID=2949996 RepID=UPI002246C31C|nr:hypothetical protein [Aquimarina sp. ERC-38]UZO80574.1 hypothetical protein NBT05_16710 [Aquimarina sp. ERC-38]